MNADEDDDEDSKDKGDDDGLDDAATAGDFEGEDTLVRRLKKAVEKTPPLTQVRTALSLDSSSNSDWRVF